MSLHNLYNSLLFDWGPANLNYPKPIQPIWPTTWNYYITTTTGGIEPVSYNFQSTKEAYVYTMDLPGCENVKVSKPKEDELRIEGTRDGNLKSKVWLLPSDAIFDKGTATYKNGVVVVTVPRKAFEPATIKVEM